MGRFWFAFKVAVKVFWQVLRGEEKSSSDEICTHPESRRVTLSGFGPGPAHWYCKECGFEFEEVVK